MEQCYEPMLRIAGTFHSNILHLVTTLGTALVTRWCYVTALHYGVMLHVCTHLKISLGQTTRQIVERLMERSTQADRQSRLPNLYCRVWGQGGSRILQGE